MDARNLLETVLNEIKTQGGPELVLDEDGMVLVGHESGVDVLMTADFEAGVVRLTAPLGNIEAANRDDLLGDLLVINLLPQVYGPFFFALSPDQKNLVLVGREQIEDLDALRLVRAFTAIAVAHGQLTQMLGATMRGQERVSEALDTLLSRVTTAAAPIAPPKSFA